MIQFLLVMAIPVVAASLITVMVSSEFRRIAEDAKDAKRRRRRRKKRRKRK